MTFIKYFFTFVAMKIKLMTKLLLFLTSGRARGITLFPFGIFIRKDQFTSSTSSSSFNRLINHEMIHYFQQTEVCEAACYFCIGALGVMILFKVSLVWYLFPVLLPFLFFYIWYFIEWIFKGYENISFEKEAFDNETNEDYISKRKSFAWFDYLF